MHEPNVPEFTHAGHRIRPHAELSEGPSMSGPARVASLVWVAKVDNVERATGIPASVDDNPADIQRAMERWVDSGMPAPNAR